MGQPMMKAHGFIGSSEEWRTLLTSDEVRAVLAKVPDKTRELFEHPPLPVAWVDYDHATFFSRAITDVLGETRSLALHGEVGQRVVKRDLSTIYRALLKVVSVEY